MRDGEPSRVISVAASAAAVAAAEWVGARLADRPEVQLRRTSFELALADGVDARLAEWGEVWLTTRAAPEPLIAVALAAAGIALRRGPLPLYGILPPLHLRVTRAELRPYEAGSWRRIIKVREAT